MLEESVCVESDVLHLSKFLKFVYAVVSVIVLLHHHLPILFSRRSTHALQPQPFSRDNLLIGSS